MLPVINQGAADQHEMLAPSLQHLRKVNGRKGAVLNNRSSTHHLRSNKAQVDGLSDTYAQKRLSR